MDSYTSDYLKLLNVYRSISSWLAQQRQIKLFQYKFTYFELNLEYLV